MTKKTHLITGSSGFLGSCISKTLGSNILTLGRQSSNNIICDLAKAIPKINQATDTIIHCAGKAHLVPRTEIERAAFYKVNVEGTRNLIKGIEKHAECIQQFIFISTIAVYGVEKGELITEAHPLNGVTPYAHSKIQAEQLLQDWTQQHGIPLLILRLPLIVGDQPPGNLGAMIRAIRDGRYPRIMGNTTRKSMVLASDVANLIKKVNGVQGIYNLTDGVHPSFEEIEEAICYRTNSKIRFGLPLSVLGNGAKIGDRLRRLRLPFPLYTDRIQKLTSTLTFSDEKARKELNWNPNPVLNFIRTEIE